MECEECGAALERWGQEIDGQRHTSARCRDTRELIARITREIEADDHVHVWNDHGDWSECIQCKAVRP